MSTNAASFIGNIPTHYDSGLGPHIFDDYAAHLAQLCAGFAPRDLLEIAAGTGIVSRKLRDALPPQARMTVTDLNAPMLAIAQKKFDAGEQVRFNAANAMQLPFEDGAFDLLACQFGVMFFPDKPASYREAARVLKPGGHYVFNVWGSMAENPFSQVADTVAARFFPDNPPGFYKVPFHYHDPAIVRADLAAAGWTQVAHTTQVIQKQIADSQAFANALVFGNPLIDEINDRGNVDPKAVASAIYDALHVKFGPDQMIMPLSTTTFTCQKP